MNCLCSFKASLPITGAGISSGILPGFTVEKFRSGKRGAHFRRTRPEKRRKKARRKFRNVSEFEERESRRGGGEHDESREKKGAGSLHVSYAESEIPRQDLRSAGRGCTRSAGNASKASAAAEPLSRSASQAINHPAASVLPRLCACAGGGSEFISPRPCARPAAL